MTMQTQQLDWPDHTQKSAGALENTISDYFYIYWYFIILIFMCIHIQKIFCH